MIHCFIHKNLQGCERLVLENGRRDRRQVVIVKIPGITHHSSVQVSLQSARRPLVHACIRFIMRKRTAQLDWGRQRRTW